MSDNFNPYHKWLGIPLHQQPADHYRLLGLERGENDLDVIAHAAEQRTMLLRTLQTGDRAKFAQKLLNEISEARGCLLDAEKKTAYDKFLLVTPQETSSFPEPPPMIHSSESPKPPAWLSKKGMNIMREDPDFTNIEIKGSEKEHGLKTPHLQSSEEPASNEDVSLHPLNITFPGPPPLATIAEPPAPPPAIHPEHSIPTPPPLPDENKFPFASANAEVALPSWVPGETIESNDSESIKHPPIAQSHDNDLETIHYAFGALAENDKVDSEEDFFSRSRPDEISLPEKSSRTSNRKKENRIRLVGHILAPIIGLILGWVILQFLTNK